MPGTHRLPDVANRRYSSPSINVAFSRSGAVAEFEVPTGTPGGQLQKFRFPDGEVRNISLGPTHEVTLWIPKWGKNKQV